MYLDGADNQILLLSYILINSTILFGEPLYIFVKVWNLSKFQEKFHIVSIDRYLTEHKYVMAFSIDIFMLILLFQKIISISCRNFETL